MVNDYKNFAIDTLAAGISSSDTTATLTAGAGTKIGLFGKVTIWDSQTYSSASAAVAAGHGEIIRFTRSGGTLTITERGADGTTAVNLNVAGKVYTVQQSPTAEDYANPATLRKRTIPGHTLTLGQPVRDNGSTFVAVGGGTTKQNAAATGVVSAIAGDDVYITTAGDITISTASWTAGAYHYVHDNGSITADSANVSAWQRTILYAFSATTGIVLPGEPADAAKIPESAMAAIAAEVDVAAGTTCDIGAAASQLVRITGSSGPITSFGMGAAGLARLVRVASTPTLTHNATSLILPTAANITCAAGDSFIAVSLGSGNWRIQGYQRASGAALVGSTGSAGDVSVSGNTLDWSLGDTFRKTLAADTTIAMTNMVNGESIDFFVINPGAFALSWSGVQWDGDSTPSQATAGKASWYKFTRAGGITWGKRFATDISPPDETGPIVSSVTSSTSNGTHGVGASINIQVVFNEVVNVLSGTPQILLATGGGGTLVNLSSGTGTTTLSGTYTVASGHSSADLDYVGTSSLTLNGATIKDSAGNDANLTLFAPGDAGSLSANKALVIDGIVPTVTSAEILASGDVLRLTFSRACSVGAGGSGGLTLSATGGAVTATYSSGIGTTTWDYDLDRTIGTPETVTRSYTNPGNGIEDSAAGNDLGNFSAQAVTNSSGYAFVPDQNFEASPSGGIDNSETGIWHRPVDTSRANWARSPGLGGSGYCMALNEAGGSTPLGMSYVEIPDSPDYYYKALVSASGISGNPFLGGFRFGGATFPGSLQIVSNKLRVLQPGGTSNDSTSNFPTSGEVWLFVKRIKSGTGLNNGVMAAEWNASGSHVPTFAAGGSQSCASVNGNGTSNVNRIYFGSDGAQTLTLLVDKIQGLDSDFF
jgi:hypothetical protein